MRTSAENCSTDRTKRGRARAQTRAGFTLVELLVAMTAGLIVALAVVALSREASNTFHEETRFASAEMQLRTAIDRLRNDVARASFMSTGNVYLDPKILNTTVATTNVGNISATTYKSVTAMSLYSLAGIRLWAGGSAAATPLSAFNGLSPDTIDLGGNLTGVEVLQIGGVAGGGHAIDDSTGCGGAGQRVYLNVSNTPALWRLVGMGPTGTDPAYGAQLVNAFQPVNGASFMVRVVDNATGQVQYAATCATTSGSFNDTASEPASWNGTSGIPQPYIDLDSNALVHKGVTWDASINPVQIVRWKIGPTVIIPPSGADATKYDLTRQYIDAKGNLVGAPEAVAEYAVDLKFAFTVDNLSDQNGDYSTAGNSTLVVNSFEDTSNAVITNAIVAGDVSTSLVPYSGGVEPQRIRSVRIRLVTRTPMQDRAGPLPVSGAPTDYLYRYCLVQNTTTCAQAGAPFFARTRTVISEVALPNQARLWFR